MSRQLSSCQSHLDRDSQLQLGSGALPLELAGSSVRCLCLACASFQYLAKGALFASSPGVLLLVPSALNLGLWRLSLHSPSGGGRLLSVRLGHRTGCMHKVTAEPSQALPRHATHRTDMSSVNCVAAGTATETYGCAEVSSLWRQQPTCWQVIMHSRSKPGSRWAQET